MYQPINLLPFAIFMSAYNGCVFLKCNLRIVSSNVITKSGVGLYNIGIIWSICQTSPWLAQVISNRPSGTIWVSRKYWIYILYSCTVQERYSSVRLSFEAFADINARRVLHLTKFVRYPFGSQILHFLLSRLCSQIWDPPHSLQIDLTRLCSQIDEPPHSLHSDLTRLCSQIWEPPHSLQVDF